MPGGERHPRQERGRASSGVRTWDLVALFVLCCFGGLWMYEERGVLYFDEIINAAKANEGLIFDYALRPLYYALNRLSWLMIGEDVDTLRVVVLVLYGVTGFLVFRAGWVVGGRYCAWSAALGFVLSQTVLIHGIRGMPHGPAGAMTALALFLLVRSESGELSMLGAWWYGVAAGVSALAAVACHPTTIPFAVAAGLWALSGLAWLGYRERRLRVPISNRNWGVLAGLVGSAAALLVVMMLNGQGSYFRSLTQGVEVVQSENRFGFYHEPWSFYLEKIPDDPSLLALASLMLVFTLPAILLGAKRGRRALPAAATCWRCVVLLVWMSTFSLAAISALTWKFERVLVTFVPLLSLSMAAVGAAALAVLAPRLVVRHWLAAAALAVLATAGVASAGGAREAILRTAGAHPQNEFYRLTRILQSLIAEDRLGYVGSGADIRRIRRSVRAADQQLVRISDGDESAISSRSLLERELATEELEFIIVNFPEAPPNRHEARWWEEGFQYTWLDEVYQHRDRFELWRVRPRESELSASLAELARGTQIAVLGQPGELGPRLAAWVAHLLEEHRLRGYRLWLIKSPRVQFRYVQGKKLRHVLVTPTQDAAHNEHLEGFRRLVIEAGGKKIATDSRTSAELWEIDH